VSYPQNGNTYIGLHTNLYSAKNRENESEALKQDDYRLHALLQVGCTVDMDYVTPLHHVFSCVQNQRGSQGMQHDSRAVLIPCVFFWGGVDDGVSAEVDKL